MKLIGMLVGTLALTQTAPVQDAASGAPTIVLVHGAFADGSGWRPVYDRLLKDGFEVVVVQQPLTGLAEDVAATRRELARIKGSVVLVGHSYGGAVIGAAGDDPKVRSLVYVAALQPDRGESVGDLVSSAPPANDDAVASDGYLSLKVDRFPADFAADLPPEQAKFMARSQRPIAAAAFATPASSAAWRNKPSYAILTTQDHALSPTLQRRMYERAGSKITTIASSHAVFLSHPDDVAKVIETAARSKDERVSRHLSRAMLVTGVARLAKP